MGAKKVSRKVIERGVETSRLKQRLTNISSYVILYDDCYDIKPQFEPETDTLHGQMRDAWKKVPAWAHPVQASREGF
ncbi:MAG: hypothetical protein ABIF87_13240 [Pseudomonadota bacterium]